MDYLKSLHIRHENWLKDQSLSDPMAIQLKDVPTLILEVDDDFENTPARFSMLVGKIREFLNGLI